LHFRGARKICASISTDSVFFLRGEDFTAGIDQMVLFWFKGFKALLLGGASAVWSSLILVNPQACGFGSRRLFTCGALSLTGPAG